MTMIAGQLDRRIVFWTVTQGVDSRCGENTETLTELDTVWAKVSPVRGRELWASRQVSGVAVHHGVSGEASTRFTVRWRSDLNVTIRIGYDGRYYDIVHIAELGRRVGLDIWTTARVE